MKLGIIKPTYSGEKRVALLPDDIDSNCPNELVVERGLGYNMGMLDEEYIKKGCKMATREQIFAECDTVFCLKLLQPADYKLLRKGQMIIGWTHPTGSGTEFYQKVAVPNDLKIVDLDNIYPTIHQGERHLPVSFIPKNFVWKNSFYAGYASTQHALMTFGLLPDINTKVAVLASGSVAQGAYNCISKYNVDIRMFYRKTMQEFYDTISEYDVIINGIEVDGTVKHIITKDDLRRVKRGCLIIDSAADAGNAIEGTHYTSIAEPMYEEDGLFFYEVNNAPSLLYRNSSREISKSFSQYVFNLDVEKYHSLLK